VNDVGLRDCGEAEVWALQGWLDQWVGTTRWPPPGLTPGPAARAGLIWADAPIQKVVVAGGRDIALCTLHDLDLFNLHATLSWLADPTSPAAGDGIAAFVALALRSFPVRKLTFEVASDGAEGGALVSVPVHRVGRRPAHLRRDATRFADVDIYEVRRGDVAGVETAWEGRVG